MQTHAKAITATAISLLIPPIIKSLPCHFKTNRKHKKISNININKKLWIPSLTVEDDYLNFKFSGSFALLRMTAKKEMPE